MRKSTLAARRRAGDKALQYYSDLGRKPAVHDPLPGLSQREIDRMTAEFGSEVLDMMQDAVRQARRSARKS